MMMFTLPGAALDWAGKVIIIIIIIIVITIIIIITIIIVIAATDDDVQVPGAALDCHNLFLIVLRIQRCCENANDGRDEIDLRMARMKKMMMIRPYMPFHG